ncbi:MAG: SGNH/GDSL hydrolase family protein [Sphingobacteriaceae bacterium]|nr:SGNH/GDSL hydrolase family protein [Sphingobacteriaceae bacterium]
MADINNIETIQDLKDCISEYLKTPRVPAIKGSELNILLSKTIELVPTGSQTAVQIRDLLVSLTGSDRLPASSIKDLPTGGEVSDLVPHCIVFGSDTGAIEQDSVLTYDTTKNRLTNEADAEDQSGSIVVMGDSIAYGIGASSNAKRFSTLLSGFLDLEELNFGVPGAGIGHEPAPVKTPEMKRLIVEYGINDYRTPGDTAVIFQSKYSDFLNECITVKGWSADEITLLSIPATQPDLSEEDEVKIREYNLVIETLATSFGVNYVNVFDGMIANGGSSFLTYDGTHPNDNGHEVIAILTLGGIKRFFNLSTQGFLTGKVIEGVLKHRGNNLLPPNTFFIIGSDKHGNLGLVNTLRSGTRTEGKFYINGLIQQIGSSIPESADLTKDILLKTGTAIRAAYSSNVHNSFVPSTPQGHMEFRSHYSSGEIRFFVGTDGDILAFNIGQDGSLNALDIIQPFGKKIESIYSGGVGTKGRLVLFSNTNETKISNFFESGKFKILMSNGVSGDEIEMLRMDALGNVIIGNSEDFVPDNSAKFRIDSINQGFLKPRLTSSQRDSIPTPAEGLEIYNLTTHKTNYFDGTNWMQLMSEPAI